MTFESPTIGWARNPEGLTGTVDGVILLGLGIDRDVTFESPTIGWARNPEVGVLSTFLFLFVFEIEFRRLPSFLA